MKKTAVDVRVRTRQGVKIAHAISVAIYLFGAVSVTSVLGGIVLQMALQGSQGDVAATSSSNAVTLQWTAPGDDANVGTADSYSVRYSTSPLSEVNWPTASVASNPPDPLVAGSSQSMTVTGLTPNTLYYFAVKTTDEAGNQSSISNVVSKRTDALACIPTWSCTAWSGCINGEKTRSCIDTNVPSCNSDLNKPIERQTCTTPTPQPATCTENWSCSSWTLCVNGVRTRTCTDSNACGTTASKPATTYDCSVGGAPDDFLGAMPQTLVSVPAKGGGPQVRAFATSRKKVSDFFAYAKSFRKGLSVDGGDVNGDGNPEIVVGTGVGASPQVSLFNTSGRTLLRFFAFPSRLRTGVNVALADVDGDGRDELIAAPAGNYPGLVRVFRYDGTRRTFTRMTDISTMGGRFRGGLNIEAGDLDRNGLAEIIVSPAARARNYNTEIYQYNLTGGKFSRTASFSPYGRRFNSGVATAIGDIDGDGNNDIITAPAPGATDIHIYAYRNRRVVYRGNFFAASKSFRGGVDLASLDVNKDGRDDIITVSWSKGPSGIRVFTKHASRNTYSRITSPFPAFMYGTRFQGGVRLGTF